MWYRVKTAGEEADFPTLRAASFYYDGIHAEHRTLYLMAWTDYAPGVRFAAHGKRITAETLRDSRALDSFHFMPAD
jgi:hypothetical protein